MKLFFSHQLDRLVQRLSERLEQRGLEESWILLPSPLLKQWLMLKLAECRPLAGLQIFSWREAIVRLCGPAVPRPLELQLSLAEFFAGPLPDSFAALREWLAEGRSSRLAALVGLLSRQMREAGFYGLEGANEWQRHLLSALPGAFPVQLLAQAKMPPAVRQVHCFCTDELPAAVWSYFRQAGVECNAYLFSPCRMYWEDLCSDKEKRALLRRGRAEGVSRASLAAAEELLRDTHPLLANWGRLGRQALRGSEWLEGEEDEGPLPAGTRLLQCVQRDLLLLRTEEGAARESVDRSIEIVGAGSSLLREVQILRDQVLQAVAEGAKYSDLLVLAPDLSAYEPLVHFVFGDEVPYRMAPVPVLPRNRHAQALRLFFGLSERRWEVDDVLALFENRAFQAKQGLSTEELETVRGWLEEAKIRGGWDRRKGNWPDGLKSLLSGLVYLLPEGEGPRRIRNVDWGQADLLEKLFALLELLQAKAELLLQSRPLSAWAVLLSETADALFHADEGEDELFRTFVRNVAAAEPRFGDAAFGFSLLRAAFEEECGAATTVHQGMALETVSFSALQPGGLRPAKRIFLIGLDSERFPRSSPRSSLDWAYPKIDEGERDCYLLLQALFAAEEKLCISYCHLSPDDGQAVEPALPVQELLQLIDRFYPLPEGKMSAAITTLHPTLPFDRRYFESGSGLSSYSQEAFRIASADKVAPAGLWPARPLSPQPAAVYDLSDLLLLARSPWKYFLKRRVGIYLKEESLFADLRLKDFALPVYEQQRLLKQGLQKPLDSVMRRVDWPPGAFGEWAGVQMRQKAAEWDAFLDKWGVQKGEIFSAQFGEHSERPPIVLPSGIQIVGAVDLLCPSGVMMMSDKSFFSLLRHWPAFLVSLYVAGAKSGTFYSLKAGTKESKEGIDPLAALQRWVEYAARAEQTLSPLIDEWAEPFLRQGEEVWLKQARLPLQKDDPSLQWVYDRAEPLPLPQIWNEWNGFLREALHGLL